MTGGQLAFGMAALVGGLYLVYRIAIWCEKRHRERCYICAREIELAVRDWKRDAQYWDSVENRWAHYDCRLGQLEEMSKMGGA